MRLLHTSDWHLGKLTYNVSRRPDHESVHAEIIAHARDFAPDLIVHTGDLFDVKMPSVDDLRLGIEMLDVLAALAPVVVLCGNHENPKLFRLFQLLRGGERLRFVDRARAPQNGGVLDYPARDGDRIRLAPLPFVTRTAFLEDFEDPASWSSAYGDRIAQIEAALGAGLVAGGDRAHDVCVFAAHLHVTGAILARSERQVHIDDYATRPEAIPSVAYAAFGHIHKPQALAGRPWARYAGSPIPIDFGEVGETKSIVLVEARPGKNVHVRTAPLGGGRPMRRERGTLDVLAARGKDLAGALALVTVEAAGAQQLLFEEVQRRLPHTTLLAVDTLDPNRHVDVVEVTDASSEPELEELFATYLADHGKADADNRRIAELFAEAVRAVAGDEAVRLSELDDVLEVTST